MANQDQLALLKQGVEVWNQWRKEHPDIRPDLSGANLSGANLHGANLERANLHDADLSNADLHQTNLGFTNFNNADLHQANLSGADLWRANLSQANLHYADLSWTEFIRADLSGADLSQANLHYTDLSQALLVKTKLHKATLNNCRVYGIAAWDIDVTETDQSSLIITDTNSEEPTITVDNLKIAQFIYLLLNNQEIRDVIDTITSKVVLILGRFTPERKAVLDALRDELRKRNYSPVLFDFDKPASRDLTETVSILAHMARFIIADLTEPSSIPKELEAIVPTLAVPVQPLLEGSTRPYAMFKDYWKYQWVLEVYRYNGLEELLASLKEHVIEPAERKAKELAKLRAQEFEQQ
jgi:uncharacterized protein YjbI with pentapeptide repeats